VPELAEDVSMRQQTPAYASIRQHTARATAPAPLLPLDMLPHAGEVDLLHRRVAGRYRVAGTCINLEELVALTYADVCRRMLTCADVC
jgi:hypothetical protein